jgi:hypothetical protein
MLRRPGDRRHKVDDVRPGDQLRSLASRRVRVLEIASLRDHEDYDVWGGGHPAPPVETWACATGPVHRTWAVRHRTVHQVQRAPPT